MTLRLSKGKKVVVFKLSLAVSLSMINICVNDVAKNNPDPVPHAG